VPSKTGLVRVQIVSRTLEMISAFPLLRIQDESSLALQGRQIQQSRLRTAQRRHRCRNPAALRNFISVLLQLPRLKTLVFEHPSHLIFFPVWKYSTPDFHPRLQPGIITHRPHPNLLLQVHGSGEPSKLDSGPVPQTNSHFHRHCPRVSRLAETHRCLLHPWLTPISFISPHSSSPMFHNTTW